MCFYGPRSHIICFKNHDFLEKTQYILLQTIYSDSHRTQYEERTILSADLAITNATIITMNPQNYVAEAIAIKRNRILKVGTNEDVLQLIGKKTRVINLAGKTLVPGFIDTHIHVADFGRYLSWMDLREVGSIKQLQKALREHVRKTPFGKWIIGRGWNESRFKERRFPTNGDIDPFTPNNPVILYHESAQICLVNSKALESAEINKQTLSPPDGEIGRNKEGELTGILRDSATNLVWKIIPEPSRKDLLEMTAVAFKKIAQAGVTSLHWIVASAEELSLAQTLLVQRKLPIRLFLIIPANLLNKPFNLGSKDCSSSRIGAAMIIADGYLAAKSAALFQPYWDSSNESGNLLLNQVQMRDLAYQVISTELQLIIHAVGDRAIDQALTTIEHISKDNSNKIRFRLEQAAVLNDELIQRLQSLKVIVSVQPLVVASEFSTWSAEERLGPERARWLYPLKTLLKRGICVIGGSDCPMEPLSPLHGIQSAITRKAFPEESITAYEALEIYTKNAAYSSCEEDLKGSVEEGKLADLTVLSDNPLALPPDQIAGINVEMTIVDGKIVYAI